MSNGGPSARKGFHYQDCAAAYYFLSDEKVDDLLIEVGSDFAIFFPSQDPPQKHFFQAKSSDTGPFGWGKFKNTLPEFVNIATDTFDGETDVNFHIIANHKPNTRTKEFLDESEKVRENVMGWIPFRARHKREVNEIEDIIDENTDVAANDDILSSIIPSISISFHSKDEFITKSKNVLENNHMGRYSHAFEIIVNEIRSTSKGGIKRSKIENKIGFDLKTSNNGETSTSTDINELRQEVSEIRDKYSSNADSMDVTTPLLDSERIENLAEYEAKGSETSSAMVEGSRANILDELERIKNARREEREASRAVANDIDDLLSATDSTNPEEKQEDSAEMEGEYDE